MNLTTKTEYRKMKIEKTEFGNKTDFIGPYNIIFYFFWENSLKYIYNSNDALIDNKWW